MGQFKVSKRIVITGSIPVPGIKALQDAGFSPVAWGHDHQVTRTELLELVKGTEVLITLLTEKVDDELLDAAGSQLKAVCNDRLATWRGNRTERSC